MASASVSAGASPLSGFEFEFPQHPDSASDPDDAFWTAISNPSSGSLGPFLSSPSHSLGSSWAVLGNGQLVELEPSPAALPSPLDGSYDQQSPYSGASFAEQAASTTALSAPTDLPDVSFLSQGLTQQDGLEFLAPGEFVFDQSFNGEDLDPVFNHFSSASILEEQQPSQRSSIDIPQPMQSAVDVPPWEPVNLRTNNNINTNINTNPRPAGEASPIFIIEDPSFISPSPSHEYSPSLQSASVSPPASGSPHSPVHIKRESGLPEPSKPLSASATTAPKAIPSRKLASSSRVQKRKSAAPATTTTSSANHSPSSSTASSTASKFLIVTPSSITLSASASASLNPFECFDALSRGPTQRGRKGPLATDTKQSALVVRRMGACFSCHARKVRCDKERPCRSCTRLACSVPQVVCWQFSDFTPVLFPAFIRTHLRREEVVKFVEGNVASFTVDGGVERPCTVQLISGVGFGPRAVLEIKAKFFTARTPDVLQQWHVIVGQNGMDLFSRGAAPIGLDTGDNNNEGRDPGSGGQKAELKKRVREYVQAIVDEPRFAELVTPPPQHTELPRKVLRIVHDYANRADAPMVRRALSIYAMHFVMTRHLCMTARNISDLQSTGLVPQGVPWVTPRVLNRQIKAVVDEMLCREMQLLFENFSKSLKPKLRREWAPCLASFLVLCLFMESVEVAADTFVVSDNEINLRHHYAPAWKRAFVLDINAQIENMPFKQFAFQFHQIYQTHSRDAAARSFNPLVDDACFELGELDREAGEMVRKLRGFIDDDWSELDYLTADPILPNTEDHPYPRNLAYSYTGRLLAKFLLSFTDEKYIFDSKT
ncbi:hypothetical protein C8A05DRAFT_19276 [Staphylotrichum tortipilum]|uniref:Zn(2)-C6 fungal-type domain-containing protein n=1 Tax=Staphylotrichum tortipilum TaxID=2831512 RepID=A0AAN6MC61_9PEZI|nr:hypothetical protein C8A05DRAFT_19276 [Staphylotrichum longicolle]